MDDLTLHPSTTALLLIDAQERLLGAMPSADAERLVAAAALLLEAARLFHLPVLVTEQHPKGLGPTVAPLEALLAGLEAPAFRAEKTVFSALGVEPLAAALRTTGARSVVLVGMEAHVCVLQTARALRAQGYLPHIPFDAVASREPAAKQTALAALAAHGVTVTSSETVAFDLLGDAKHPHFKQLSARVKALPLRG